MTELLNTAFVVMQGVSALVAPFFLPVTVESTAYTCDPHPRNPMIAPGMCIALANGSRDVMSSGMACPRHWMGLGFYVPGEGVLHCDDTGAYSYLRDKNGVLRPHSDIRVSDFDTAWQWGTPAIVIYHILPREVVYVRFRVLPTPPARCRLPVGACAPDDLQQRGNSVYPERWN